MKGFFFLEEGQADTDLQYYFHTVDATVDAKWALAKGVTHTFTDIDGVSRVARGGKLFNSVYVKNGVLLGPLVTGTAANDSFGSLEAVVVELPTNLSGNAGKSVIVNEEETGYDLGTGGSPAASVLIDLDNALYRTHSSTAITLTISVTSEPALPQVSITVPTLPTGGVLDLGKFLGAFGVTGQNASGGARDIFVKAKINGVTYLDNVGFGAGVSDGQKFTLWTPYSAGLLAAGDIVTLYFWVDASSITLSTKCYSLFPCSIAYPDGDMQLFGAANYAANSWDIDTDGPGYTAQVAVRDIETGILTTSYFYPSAASGGEPTTPIIRPEQDYYNAFVAADDTQIQCSETVSSVKPVTVEGWRYARLWPA